MGIHQKIEEERLRNYQWNAYTYFQTPDGKDLHKKFLYLSKMAIGGSVLAGLFDANAKYPRAKTFRDRLFRTTKYMLPAVGMAGAYAATAYYGTILREKDDAVNHFLAGLAAGGVFGMAIRQGFAGMYVGIFIGLIGVSAKYKNLNGEKYFPTIVRRHYGSYYQRNADLSLLPDNIRGNWSKELPTSE